VISAHGLSRSFDGRPAVEALTFHVPEGKLFALLGPNGAGKTTTVRMLLGLIGPTSGSATVAGHAIGGDPLAARAVRAVCGLLTEAPGFYDRLSGWDNLLFFGSLYGMPDAVVRTRVTHYLRLMDLWDRRDEAVGGYSKGMKQRLAIIRALFHDPKVVFFDEPTSGLDPEAALAVRDLIVKLKDEGRTIVVCTHNLDEAERLADLVGILKRRLLVCDTLERLRAGAGDGARVHVAVRAGAAELARRLQGQPFAPHVDVTGETLRVTVGEAALDTPRVVAALVGGGAEILEVRPETPSLESIYLHTLRGDH
jgi:ABC-2 type transport system ATP-binding protein